MGSHKTCTFRKGVGGLWKKNWFPYTCKIVGNFFSFLCQILAFESFWNIHFCGGECLKKYMLWYIPYNLVICVIHMLKHWHFWMVLKWQYIKCTDLLEESLTILEGATPIAASIIMISMIMMNKVGTKIASSWLMTLLACYCYLWSVYKTQHMLCHQDNPHIEAC